MKKRPLRIILFVVLFLSLLLLGASGYLRQARYFGPLSVEAQQPGHIVSVVGLSPSGTMLSLKQRNGTWSSDDERFYQSLIVSTTGAGDTLVIRYGSYCETHITEGPSAFVIPFSQNRFYGVTRKLNDSCVFFLKSPWLRFAGYGFVIFVFGVWVYFKRKSIPLLFKRGKSLATQAEFSLRSKRSRWGWSAFCTLLVLLISLGINASQEKGKQPFIPDDVVYVKHNPDQIDYQTIAVNFATNSEFPVNGLYHDVSVYHIQLNNSADSIRNKEEYNKLFYIQGIYSLHRFPAYPVFIGIIYKCFGIHPLSIKLIQLLIILCVVFCFPLLGYKIWQSKGFAGGILAAPFFFAAVFPLIDSIAPDIFTIGFNFFVIWLYCSYRLKPSVQAIVMVAVLAGISILFKASLMYVIPLLVLDMLWMSFQQKSKSMVWQCLLFMIIFMGCWGPYNLWSIRKAADIRKNAQSLISLVDRGVTPDSLNVLLQGGVLGERNQRVFTRIDSTDIAVFRNEISPYIRKAGVFNVTELDRYSQNSIQLGYNLMAVMHDDYYFMIMLYPINGGLHCHNEYISDGMENDAWVFDSNSFYNRDKLPEAYWARRVANFYYNHPEYIISVAYSKLRNVMTHASVIGYSAFIFFLWLAVFFGFKISLKRAAKILVAILALVAMVAVAVDSRTLVFIFPFTILLIPFFPVLRKQIPLPFIFLMLSLVLFPLVTVGVPRYSTYYFFPLFLLAGYWVVDTLSILAMMIKKRRLKNAPEGTDSSVYERTAG